MHKRHYKLIINILHKQKNIKKRLYKLAEVLFSVARPGIEPGTS